MKVELFTLDMSLLCDVSYMGTYVHSVDPYQSVCASVQSDVRATLVNYKSMDRILRNNRGHCRSQITVRSVAC